MYIYILTPQPDPTLLPPAASLGLTVRSSDAATERERSLGTVASILRLSQSQLDDWTTGAWPLRQRGLPLFLRRSAVLLFFVCIPFAVYSQE